MLEWNPPMLALNAMKQYLKYCPSSVAIRVTVPGFLASNLAKYNGSLENDSSAVPLTLFSACSLARHALSYDISTPYFNLKSNLISRGLYTRAIPSYFSLIASPITQLVACLWFPFIACEY